MPWREGELPERVQGRVGLAVADGRFALAREDGVVVGPWRDDLVGRLRGAQIVAHDYKSLPRLTQLPADDTMIEAYLIEPGRPVYALDDLAAEYGVEALPDPEVEEETAALVRAAEVPHAARGAAAPAPARTRQRARSTTRSSCRSPRVLAAMEDAGVKIDTYRMGEITARLADRVEELESSAYELAGEEFMLGSTQQLARILFEKLELTPGRKGKTGYSTDTRVLRTIRGDASDRRGDRGVARAVEAPQHVPRPAAGADRRGRPAAHALQPGRRGDRTPVDVEPEPAGDPDPHGARAGDPLCVRRRAGSPARVGRLLPDRAAHPRARLGRAEAARGVRAR